MAGRFRVLDSLGGSGPGWRYARPGDLKDADAIVDEELERLMDARPAGKLGALDATLKILFFLALAVTPGFFVALAAPDWQEGRVLMGLIAVMAASGGGVWAIGRLAERDFADAAEKIGLNRARATAFYKAFRNRGADAGE